MSPKSGFSSIGRQSLNRFSELHPAVRVYLKRVLILLVIGIVASLLGACGTTTRPITRSDLAAMKQAKHIEAVAVGTQSMMVETPNQTIGEAFGAIGAILVANSEADLGKAWIRTYAIPDPTVTVEDQLAEEIESRNHLTKIVVDSTPLPERNFEDLRFRFGNDSLVIAVDTLAASLIHYPSKLSHYHLWYRARAELVSLSDGKTLWVGSCKTQDEPSDSKMAPTMEEVKANNGAWLKATLKKAARGCVKQIAALFPVN